MVTRTIRTVNRNISTCETLNSTSEPLVGRPQHCSSYVDVREVITESTEYSITAEIVGDLDSHLSYGPMMINGPHSRVLGRIYRTLQSRINTLF